MRNFSSVLRIIQVSDCHVSADSATDYRGQNADRNLKSLLPVMRSWQPELILLTGDVSEDASAASYGRVSAMLNSIGAPVMALPGNHDHPATMQKFFPRGPWSGPFAEVHRGWRIVVLDSTQAGKIHGVLPQGMLNQMDGLLQQQDAPHTMLALHHQPVAVQSPWIDRYALRFPGAFEAVLNRHESVRAVVWGHVHQDFDAERNSVRLLGAPSSVANSLPHKEKFTLDMRGPACRWLELKSNGEVETGLLFAGEKPA